MKYFFFFASVIVTAAQSADLKCESPKNAPQKIEITLKGYQQTREGFEITGGTLTRTYTPPLASGSKEKRTEHAEFTTEVTAFGMVPVFRTLPAVREGGNQTLQQTFILVLYGTIGSPKGILLSETDGSLKESALVCAR